MASENDGKWYRAGLHFECSQCGNCCGGFPGYVWVTAEEIQNIAAFLDMSVDQFQDQYTIKVGKRRSLIEKKHYDCIFLERNGEKGGCSIYSVRPQQCRTWPFWKTNLATPDTWNDQLRRCLLWEVSFIIPLLESLSQRSV